jgi:hypothetical protein
MVNFVKSGQAAAQPKKVEKKIESESEESEEESEESESEHDKKKKSTVQTKTSAPAAIVKKPVAASKKMEVESEEEEEEEESEEEDERPSFGGGAKKVTTQIKTPVTQLKKVEPVEVKSKVENNGVVPETNAEFSGHKQSFNKADYSRFSNLREELKDYSFEVIQ